MEEGIDESFGEEYLGGGPLGGVFVVPGFIVVNIPAGIHLRQGNGAEKDRRGPRKPPGEMPGYAPDAEEEENCTCRQAQQAHRQPLIQRDVIPFGDLQGRAHVRQIQKKERIVPAEDFKVISDRSGHNRGRGGQEGNPGPSG